MKVTQAYLDGEFSLKALSKWLISKTAYFCDNPPDPLSSDLWATACHLTFLWSDRALTEDEVKAELREWLAEHPPAQVHTSTPR